jgi:RsiW-degrading membrane proteinase PrsW (M82 family)
LAGILLMVALREILKLMTLRYGMLRHEAFNEKTDGILYGSAIGLGFSAMMNLDYVASAGGALLSAAVPQMVITSLIQASLGGLGGYWLGLAVFSRQPRWRLPVCLAGLVLLGGIMQLLPALTVRQGFKVNYLIGLVPSAIAALAVFLALILLIRRDGALLKGMQGDRKTRHEGFVLGVGLILALFCIVFLHAWQERLTPVSPLSGVTVSIPAKWSALPVDGTGYAAGNRFAGGEQSGFVRAAALPEFTGAPANGTQADGEDAIHGLAAWWTMKSASDAVYYQPVHTEFLFRDGKWLAVIESLRLEPNQPDSSGLVPTVLRWRDVVWLEDSGASVISLYAAEADGKPDLRLMDRMVASMRFGLSPVKGGGAE